MSVTLKDVAKYAKVGTSTASRVINNSGYVSEGTRAKVVDAIEQLGYVPNSIARSLKQKRTFSVGLIVSDIGNPFYAELAQAVEKTARNQGYSVLLVNTDRNPIQEEDGVKLLISKQVDGIIWYSPLNEKLVTNLCKMNNLDIVVISGKPALGGHHTIYLDDQLGAFQAVDHLIQLGHKRIGYIAEPDGNKVSQERLKGYLSALQKRAIVHDFNLISRGTFQEGSGLQAIKTLLKRCEDITAVFCANDLMAIEVIQHIRKIGLRVPEDIAVVGFDDTKIAGLRGIDLTTVAQPICEIGTEAANLLIGSKGRSPEQILLQPSLVIRKTCGYGLSKEDISLIPLDTRACKNT